MKKYILFISALLCSSGIYAQYCSLQENTKLYYEVRNNNGKKEICTTVSRVETQNDTTFITLTDLMPKLNENMAGTPLRKKITYSNGNTIVYLQDAETEKDNISAMVSNIVKNADSLTVEKNYSTEGQVCITLNDHVKAGEKITPCKGTIKVGPLKINTTLKGEYTGNETVETPAGKFECIKVKYTVRTKALITFDTSEVTEWYAKGIGLVKHEEKSKKYKTRTEKILNRIEQGA